MRNEMSTRPVPPAHDALSPLSRLLSRLDGIRERGNGQYMARCPAHGDRSPSLSIRELPDGTLLIRCFAGCDARAITEAVGLTLADLFPRKTTHHSGPVPRYRRPRLSAGDALRLVSHEAALAAVIASDLHQEQRPPTREELDMLWHAAGRIQFALEEVRS